MVSPPGNIQPAIDRFEKQLRAQDGHFKLEPCRSTELPFIEAGSGPTEELFATQDVEPAYTCACGNSTRASYPAEGPDGKQTIVIVCAICDAATRFPRFRPVEPLVDPTEGWT